MRSNARQPTVKCALVEALEGTGEVTEAPGALVDTEVEEVGTEEVIAMEDIEEEEAQVDMVEEVEVAVGRNVVPFQANLVKMFHDNLVLPYLDKFQNKTANKFLANLANPYHVNNAHQYHASNVVQCRLKSAKVSQQKYAALAALEEVGLEALEEEVDIREEDTDTTVKKLFICRNILA